MTEQEWFAARLWPSQLLEFLEGKVSDRKLRLLAVACSRTIERFLAQSENAMQMVATAERVADGLASLPETPWLGASLRDDPADPIDCAIRTSLAAVDPDAWRAAEGAASHAHQTHRAAGRIETQDFRTLRAQTELIWDIFGNPFCPVTADASWLTSTVVALAHGIYDEKAFDRMPILADALQDTGCDNEDILNHCRSEGPHVRGCWVVDLLLGKS